MGSAPTNRQNRGMTAAHSGTGYRLRNRLRVVGMGLAVGKCAIADGGQRKAGASGTAPR